MVDCVPVWNAGGAAAYLAKYLRKDMYGEKREILEDRGFSRRFVTSRDFPSPPVMQRRGTVRKAWSHTTFEYGKRRIPAFLAGRGELLMEQVGENPIAGYQRERMVRYATNLLGTLGVYSRKRR